MKNVAVSMVLLCCLFLTPASVFGHGWACHEQGAKAHGMGGAFTGLADDPSAVYYNPAGITQIDRSQMSLGFSVPIVHGQFKSDGSSAIPGANEGDETRLDTQSFFIPQFYLTTPVSNRLFLGLGGYSVFGLGFKWPESFEGRFASGGINGEVTTVTLNPVIAYKISDKFSISLGGRIERADLELENKIFVSPGVDEVSSKMSGHDYGLGWNGGLLYRINKDLSFGLSYRSKIEHAFNDVDVEFSSQLPQAGLLDTKSDLDITLPQFVSFGLAWSKGPLTLTTDAYWYDWSKIQNITFKLDSTVAGQSIISAPMQWEDTWSWGGGGEYVFNTMSREIRVRAGIMYEQCPIPDDTVGPVGFQGDNVLYNLGVGLPVGPCYSDFFFTYVDTKDRHWNNATGDVPNPGGGRITGDFQNYETYIVGCSISYKF